MLVKCICGWEGKKNDLLYEEVMVEDGDSSFSWESWNSYKCPNCHQEDCEAFDDNGNRIFWALI